MRQSAKPIPPSAPAPPLSMEEQEELAAALDDFTAGRVIEHDAMKAWIKDRLCSLKVKSKIA